jgi:hypothetical protein
MISKLDAWLVKASSSGSRYLKIGADQISSSGTEKEDEGPRSDSTSSAEELTRIKGASHEIAVENHNCDRGWS